MLYFSKQNASEMGRESSANGRVRDDELMLGNMLRSSSNRLSSGGSNSRIFGSNLELKISWQPIFMLEGDLC